MDTHDRRALLAVRDNPGGGLDYVSGLKGTLQAFGHGKPTRVDVHYVPDRRVLEPPAFGRYIGALAGVEWASLEDLTSTILSDVNDQLVPRWLRVVVTAPEGAYPGVGSHQVIIEDRQPAWDNPALLGRIPGD